MLDSRKPIVAINLTPLVDVSLVLVVIFMATAPMFLQSGIIVTSAVKKSSASSPAPEKSVENIVVKLVGETIQLNEHVVSETEFPRLLGGMLSSSAGKRVIVNPDRDVRHGRVIRIMDLAKQAGAEHLVVLGKPKTNEESK